MHVADDQLGVGANVHDRDEPLLMGHIDRKHSRRRIRTHVSADNRRPVDPRPGMDRQKAVLPGLGKARGRALARGHFDFCHGLVRTLPD